MKAASELDDIPTLSIEESRSPIADFMELTKARLNMMVLITTMIGFVIAVHGTFDWILLLETMIGTGLCAAGASVFNQAWEYKLDALMNRTSDRPIAAGRMRRDEANLLGFVLSVCGLVFLGLGANLTAAVLSLSTIVLYVLVYTPLKRVTTLNTLVGAIPGAIPPVIGYAAASKGTLDLEAFALFAILFCWQMPHFLAIAILCKDDYAAAGYKMMPVVDRTLTRTNLWIVAFGLLLIASSLIPLWVKPTSLPYTITAIVLGGLFLAAGIRCAILQTRPAARLAFFASIIYLPLALAALMIERLI